MLVLTRKSNQSIMIGDDMEVSVLSVMGEKVRIGIQAPQEIPVFRKEIYLEIHREDGTSTPALRSSKRRGPRSTTRSASSARAEPPNLARRGFGQPAPRRPGGTAQASRRAGQSASRAGRALR